MSGTELDTPPAQDTPVEQMSREQLIELVRRPDFRIVQEPLTYRSPDEAGEHSYFADRTAVMRHQDPDAKARLEQHAKEWRVEMRHQDMRAMLAAGQPWEVRVTPNWEAGRGGYFAPPLWWIRHFADIPRPERCLARLAPNFPLPYGVQKVNLPVLTGKGPSAAPQVLDTPGSDTDITDEAAENQVVTIAGTEDVPLPMLEQSPASASLDWLIAQALEAAYQEQLEAQLINGQGLASAQILGLLNVKGITSLEYTSATPEGTAIYPILGKAMAAIGRKRKVPMGAWLLNSARFAWIATSEDKQERPLLLSDYEGDFPTASLGSRPVYLDDAMPTLANGQEPIIACVPNDLLVLESPPHLDVYTQPGSGALQARIQLRRYVVGITSRYPTGISAIKGTGMVPVAGF